MHHKELLFLTSKQNDDEEKKILFFLWNFYRSNEHFSAASEETCEMKMSIIANEKKNTLITGHIMRLSTADAIIRIKKKRFFISTAPIRDEIQF